MKANHPLIIFVAIFTFSFTAPAEEVYESTDKEGVVEFSDVPSADAEVIDVEPNVVDVAPAKSAKSNKSVPSTTKTTTNNSKQNIDQYEVIHQGVADDYERDRVKEHKKRKEHREHDRKNVVHQPKSKAIK